MNMAKKKTSTKAKGTSPTSEAHTSGPMTTTGAGYAVGSIDTLDDTTLVVHSPDSTESVAAAGQSDVGRVRELNEDNWHLAALNENLMLYAVADGMGGHDRGEVASKLAVQALFEAAREGLKDLSDNEVATLRSLLRKCVQTANERVVITGIEEESNMGTTLCAALMHDESNAIIANVGDSRVYLLREGKLIQVSDDHSLVAYLVRLGELSAEDARNHPSGNILVRSIGSVPHVEIDLFHLPVKQGDRLMLCSDGLWGEITDEELEAIMLDNDDPRAACRALVNVANQNGGRDNTTLIVVNV